MKIEINLTDGEVEEMKENFRVVYGHADMNLSAMAKYYFEAGRWEMRKIKDEFLFDQAAEFDFEKGK